MGCDALDVVLVFLAVQHLSNPALATQRNRPCVLAKQKRSSNICPRGFLHQSFFFLQRRCLVSSACPLLLFLNTLPGIFPILWTSLCSLFRLYPRWQPPNEIGAGGGGVMGPTDRHKVEVVVNHIVELVLPWCLLLSRRQRCFAGVVQVGCGWLLGASVFWVILILCGGLFKRRFFSGASFFPCVCIPALCYVIFFYLFPLHGANRGEVLPLAVSSRSYLLCRLLVW